MFETVHRRCDGGLLEVEISSQSMTLDGVSVCHATAAPPFIAFTVRNQAMVTLTGYTQSEINRLGWSRTGHADPATQDLACRRMDRMRAGDHLQGEVWTITRKDGQQRAVKIHTTAVAHPDGPPHVLAVMQDITEHRRMQAELAADEARWRRLFEWQHRSVDGQLFHAEVRLSAITRHQRPLLHVVWRDITEKRRLGIELARHPQHLEALVEARTRELAVAREAAEAANVANDPGTLEDRGRQVHPGMPSGAG